MNLATDTKKVLNNKYSEILSAVSSWYDEFTIKNRLLLLVEGSENLQSIFLDSSVVNFHSVEDSESLQSVSPDSPELSFNVITQGIKYNIILAHSTFGLFQICLCGRLTDNRIILKPFEGFFLPSHSYLATKLYDKDKQWDIRDRRIFEETDIDLLAKMFECDLEPVKTLMDDAITSKNSLIHSRIREFIKSGHMELVKNNDEMLTFEFTDGLSFYSAEQLYERFQKELDNEFLVKYSKELDKTKRFLRKLVAAKESRIE